MLFTQADGFLVLALVAVGNTLSRTQVILKGRASEITNAFIFVSVLCLALCIVRTVYIDTRMKLCNENE